ncbi:MULTISPECIES: hypothetical protein [Thermomonas]|jgi:hypothetical protein|uniref:hypothetical protein n=1 Tax=Thermomonas TaxID=141948 RepID=UPI0003F888CB|nr:MULTISPECIES: hypothetical protein [Thermomonas]
MTESNPARTVQRRNRVALLVVLGMFFGGMLVAGALRFSGWRPDGMKNKGEMLQPYVDLRGYSPTLADGRPYAWHDDPRTWRIVAMPRDCDGARREACTRLLGDLDKVWRLMGRNADRVHVLWAGAAPVDVATLREVHLVRADARLRSVLARSDKDAAGTDPVWLVDPNGFVVLRYAGGSDPGDLRSDLARLLRVN